VEWPVARVLLADDDEMYRNVFCDGLGTMGHSVEAVPAGRDVLPALAAAGDTPFDVVFLDMMMTGGGGITILHAVREKYAELPVVIITGRVELLGSPLFLDGMRSAQAKVHKTASLAELDRLIGALEG